MRDEFKIQRQGKDFVLFAGLLDEAHSVFDQMEIHTELLMLEPIPVVRAKFKGWKPGERGQEHVFTSGIGTGKRSSDTKGAAADAPVEMAETRAKARALRDAVNVGATSLEELSDGGGTPTPATPSSQQPATATHRPAKPRQTPTPTSTPPEAQALSHEVPPEATNEKDAALKSTRGQQKALKDLMVARAAQTQQSVNEIRTGFEQFLGFAIEDLSRGEAEGYIETFATKIDEFEDQEAS